MSDGEYPLPPGADPERTVRLDARSVRGLAHPIRVKMLGLLRSEGPATATKLAERLGLNTGATSYHLRQLATYGFIVDDETRGEGRERWWKAAHDMTSFDRGAFAGDETGEAFVRSIGQIYTEKIHRAIDEYATLPPAWRTAGTLSDRLFRLTPAETEQLVADLLEVMSRYRRHDPEDPEPGPEGAAPVHVMLQAFPQAQAIAGPASEREQ
jgi:hypothetical protein